jgi:hypothetical protein
MKNRYLFTKKLCTNTFIYLGAIYDNRGCTISESDKKLVSERIENFHFILVDSDTGNNSPIIKHCVDKLEKSGYVVKWQRLNCISCSERDDYGCYQTRDIAYEVGLNIEWPETKV